MATGSSVNRNFGVVTTSPVYRNIGNYLSEPLKLAMPNLYHWIICGGMIRSGSTLQYQIASELMEAAGRGRRTGYVAAEAHEQVLLRDHRPSDLSTLKTHEFTASLRALLTRGHAAVLYCFRDIRDVVSSYQQKNAIVMSSDALRSFVKTLLERDADWRHVSNIHTSRYEDMIFKLIEEVREVAEFLSIDVSQADEKLIAERLSYGNQLQRLQSVRVEDWIAVDPVNIYDRESLLHANHLQSGEVGRFRKNLPPSQIDVIEQAAGKWLIANGYDLTS